MPSKHTADLWPIVSLLIAATLWGVFWYPLRWLEHSGIGGVGAAALIYAGTLVPGLMLLHRRWGELGRQSWTLVWLAVASGVCNITFILAMLYGDVVRALLLFYLSPVWATLLGHVILGEYISRRAYTVLGLAMLGALVMLVQPGADVVSGLQLADVLALTSGFTFALVNTLVRRAQTVSVPVKTVVAWWGVLLSAVLLIALGAEPVPQPAPLVWGIAALLGLVAMPAMTLSVQYGVTHMPVHRSAVILLFELVAGAVSSLWLSDEVISAREWLGGACVVLAAYLTARRQMED
ncbi:MAG: hypothetical protein AMJ69_06545 [Gammaproteobacteria bacterium SG8_47]|nr:MAG: hypothetical protein AMJ69_06545 [Gammaproteobacteria bacterium SG8_47]